MVLLINDEQEKIVKTFKSIREAAAYMDENGLSSLEYEVERVFKCPRCREMLPFEYKTNKGICEMCEEELPEKYDETSIEPTVVDFEKFMD